MTHSKLYEQLLALLLKQYEKFDDYTEKRDMYMEYSGFLMEAHELSALDDVESNWYTDKKGSMNFTK
jgi:hypothetical protein